MAVRITTARTVRNVALGDKPPDVPPLDFVAAGTY
jgi:hypothetical protein